MTPNTNKELTHPSHTGCAHMTTDTTHTTVDNSTQRKGRIRAGTSRRSFGASIETGGAGATNARRVARCSLDGLSLFPVGGH